MAQPPAPPQDADPKTDPEPGAHTGKDPATRR